MIHDAVAKITERITLRSTKTRQEYLSQMQVQFDQSYARVHLNCGNQAHAFAGCNATDKSLLQGETTPNLAIVTAYNDMLSAHKVYENYPELLRKFANENKATAQVAGGVPAMCDGVTQGQIGMELSLFSRDTIALSTAIALSHNMYDGVLCLGICDKIVPGMLMGALKFGFLPVAFVPGGPMPSGISNDEKARIRQDYAEGKIDRKALLKGESDSYHSPGTCTFFGTANSNQLLLEMMGLQLPGSSFVNPETRLRELLNLEVVKVNAELARKKEKSSMLAHLVNEKTMVNAIIGLLATGGSTNHTIHLIAIARAAGIQITWDDFSELSQVIPLLAKVYPNGAADVNHFHAAGGVGFIIRTLLQHGLLHRDVQTIMGYGLDLMTLEPKIKNDVLVWEDGVTDSLNTQIIRPVNDPFQPEGGIRLMSGNIGRAVVKTSAVAKEHFVITAPAIVFEEQEDLIKAFKNDELNRDFIAVLPFQGPKQNGMPELHQLTPTLTILQKRGFQVALVTDGRMSGASGKVPSAIHVVPEAHDGGFIGRIETGDVIEFNIQTGVMHCQTDLSQRSPRYKGNETQFGLGRELFNTMRKTVSSSEDGASFIV